MSSPSVGVGSFLARAGQGLSIDRRVEEPHGFDAGGVLQVLDDSRLDSRSVIEALTDLMHPTDSMYFDAIFGAFHGRLATTETDGRRGTPTSTTPPPCECRLPTSTLRWPR